MECGFTGLPFLRRKWRTLSFFSLGRTPLGQFAPHHRKAQCAGTDIPPGCPFLPCLRGWCS